MMSVWVEALSLGVTTLVEYLREHTVTCLVPAFFIAGAIAATVSKDTILKYFGYKVKRWLSHGVASISGTVLAVCSCTILPMFAGIYKRGGGIGPATTFLYSGPAINLIAIVLTARILGIGLGIARAIGAILIGIVVGLIMGYIFEGDESKDSSKQLSTIDTDEESEGRSQFASFGFFASLVGILVFATAGYLPSIVRWPAVGVSIVLTIIIALTKYSRGENKEWIHETWWLARQLVPVLFVGVFVVGVVKYFMPYEIIRSIMGVGTVLPSFLGSIIGGLLYMPTLLEPNIVGDLFGYSQGVITSGAALALLLGGPSLSLPNMLVIWRTIGAKKTIIYIILVVIFSTIAGIVFQMLVG
ncbi:permease [candidate division MSBL1 archaeon SCGC-AAA382A13]|uniref:Permease n=1 Tax=candidate division MSBL1 archaeon SCGC-AAA382A13 TaxID=1698279 RepID=A0A133VGA3_9EURY|nr:permease [candidate division MSBL1 archaeon SCGC-AAA382A13]